MLGEAGAPGADQADGVGVGVLAGWDQFIASSSRCTIGRLVQYLVGEVVICSISVKGVGVLATLVVSIDF